MRSDPCWSLAGGVLAALAAIGMYACSPEPRETVVTAISPGCLSENVLAADQGGGASLPAHTLALTFDDGPSARTLELAAYLQAQGIAAAFFVNGMWVIAQPGALAQLVSHGHLVANHSQDHHDLTDRGAFPATAAGDEALVASLADTDALIAPFLPNGRRIFRAPFGRWDARARSVLNASAMASYVGPIGWDVGDYRSDTTAADWACWQQAPALTTKACGDLFLGEIQRVDRGVVLLHDGAYGDVSNHDLTSGVGNTFDMVRYMVPLLKSAGFGFVRLDHVPAIAAQLPPLPPPPADATDAGSSHGVGPGVALAAPVPFDDPCARRVGRDRWLEPPRASSGHAH